FVYQSQRDNCLTDAEEKLVAVADLKVDDLTEWRKERLADAAIFYKNIAFSALVRQSIERPQDLPTQEELRSLMSSIQASHRYDEVALFDVEGNSRMSVPDARKPHSAVTLQWVRKALRSGQMTFADFYPDEFTKKVYLRVFVPIFDGPSGERPLGVVRLRIDPATYFYPFIQRWPTPSETAETLLIRREGNEVVYLNELRHKTGTTLTLRMPIGCEDIPAVRAALGQEGVVEGVDYRDVPVLAALRAVPDSPWFLVAKMDLTEVYSPMQQAFWLVVLFVGVLLFGVAAAVAFVWRQQQALFYRDQAEAAKALRDVNANLAITLNSIGDAVISTDLAGNIIQMNPVAESLTGWTLAEAAGRPLAEVFHILNAQTRQPVPNPVATVLETGQIVGLANHTVLLARDGSEYQVADSASPIRDADGPTQGVVLVFRDVTQEYAAAAALSKQEIFSRVMLENQSDGVVACDENMKLVLFNKTARQWHGVDARDIPPEQWSDYYTLYDTEGIAQLSHEAIPLVRAFQGEHIEQQGMAIRAKGQETRYVTASGDAFFDDFGHKLGAVIVMRDTTERKRTEEAIRRQNNLFDSLLKNLPIGVYMIEVPSGKPLLANDASFRVLGRGILPEANSETITKSYDLYKIDSNEPYPNEELPLVVAMKGVSKHVDDMIVVKPDGTRTNLEVFGSPITDDNGKIWASVVSFQDITERKLAEDKLRGVLAELEHSNKDLEQFASVASHDLQEPLRMVASYTQLLAKSYGDQLDEKAKKYIAYAVDGAIRMQRLIN
ncbi:MAG: PAS domain S-box protein, partial [bacterium]